MSEVGLNELSDKLRNTLINIKKENGVNVNKPDFRELEMGSSVSPLTRPGINHAATNSTGPNQHVRKKSDFTPNSHSGELSVESSPYSGHTRSRSCGSHRLIFSGSASSPTANVVPTGNISPSGRALKAGTMSRPVMSDVMRAGSGNYGHGSIMRGGSASKPGSDIGPANNRTGRRRSSDAEELKRLGNDCYKSSHFAEALRFYEKAITISPSNAAYHFNRVAALMGLRRFVEAVRECEEAIRLDPGYVKVHHRLGSLLLSLGQVEDARKHICLSGHQPDHVEMQKLQLVEKHLSRCSEARRVCDWRSALREVDAAIASGADALLRAEALLKLHQLDDAFSTLSNISISELSSSLNSSLKMFGMPFEVYMLLVRTQVELAKGRFDESLAAIDKAMKMDPYNAEILNLLNTVKLVCRARARGNDLFKSERFTEACSAYGEGLGLDPSNSVLYCNRAVCWFKLRYYKQSVEDCNHALCIQPGYLKALLRRASSNSKLERWSKAVRDYEILRRELPDDNEVAESLFHSQIALKKSRGEDVYNMKFGGEVESVSGLEQLWAAISSSGASVVHFRLETNLECKQISPFLDILCSRFPSINFLQVDIEESPAIANAENVRVAPTFKIYRKGIRVKEMVCPSREVLESSVRHHSV